MKNLSNQALCAALASIMLLVASPSIANDATPDGNAGTASMAELVPPDERCEGVEIPYLVQHHGNFFVCEDEEWIQILPDEIEARATNGDRFLFYRSSGRDGSACFDKEKILTGFNAPGKPKITTLCQFRSCDGTEEEATPCY